MTDAHASVPAIVLGHWHRAADREAVRYKRHGSWHSVTWDELATQVAALAHSLKGIGIGESSVVGLLGDNCYEWIVADLATQSLGASSLFMPRMPTGRMAASLESTELSIVFCKDQGDVEDLLGCGRSPQPAVVVVDPTGCSTLGDDLREFRTYGDLLGDVRDAKSGADALSEFSPSFAAGGALRTEAAGRRAAAASRLSAAELHAAARIGATWLELSARDRVFCATPFSNAASYFLDVYSALFAGTTICLPESPLSVLADLREVRPTVVCLPPRGLDLLRSTSEDRAARSARGRAWTYRTAMRRLGALVSGARPAIASRRNASYLLVGRFVLRQLGLGNARRIVAVGAAGCEETRIFFASLGVIPTAAYGDARTRGFVVAGKDSEAVSPVPGLRARVRSGRHLEVLWEGSGQEWLDTGLTVDPLDDSTYRLIGARDDEFEVNDVVVAPAPIERGFQKSRLVRRAVVVAYRGSMAAFLELDADGVRSWAAEHQVPAGSLQALSRHDLVRRELWELVERVNASFCPPGVEIVLALPLPRQLNEHEGELDSVQRAVRSTVERHFADSLSTGITAAGWEVLGSPA